MTVADVKGVKIAGLLFDAGPVNSPDAARGRHQARAQERRERPDVAPRRVLPHRRRGRGQGDDEPRREQRRRHPRRHLGLARRPRQRRRLDHQHRRHRRGRQRRRRHRVRPVRRALPALRGRLERRERQDDLLPERDAVRPAEPGGLDARRRQRLRRLQGGRRRQTHEAWGLGSYCFFNVDPSIHATRALRGAGHARA